MTPTGTGEVIEGDAVRLRPWAAGDTAALIDACNDPEIVRFMALLPHPYTEADAKWWITEGAPAAWQAGGAALAVVEPATDQVLAGVGLGQVVAGRDQAEIGYWVAPWARRRGVATAATTTLAGWAFEMGFSRLELFTARENAASQRVALAAGFSREGVRRSAGRERDGSRKDFVAFVRLADDPPGPVPRQLPDLPGGELTDGVISLRPLGPAHVEDFLALNLIPDVAATHIGGLIDREAAEARGATAESEWLAGTRADLVILDAETGAFAGDIGLWYQEPFARQAMIGYSLRPEFRGRGVATRAARLVSDWAFAQVGVARVIAGTFPENEASRRVLERAGFTREGYLKARLPARDGSRIDDIQYVRVNPAFE